MVSAIAGNQIFRIPVQRMATIAGVLYVVNIVTGLYAFYGPKSRLASGCGLVGTVTYIIITVLFYFLFKPVSRNVSLIAALFSMAGSVLGNWVFHVPSIPGVHFLVYFGFYCALIGYLIIRSYFMPHFVGVLMVCAGAGYLTFLWPSLGSFLNPYNLIPGFLGELTLTIWLLVKGVDQEHWMEQASMIAG
jgi:hypothetical protein